MTGEEPENRPEEYKLEVITFGTPDTPPIPRPDLRVGYGRDFRVGNSVIRFSGVPQTPPYTSRGVRIDISSGPAFDDSSENAASYVSSLGRYNFTIRRDRTVNEAITVIRRQIDAKGWDSFLSVELRDHDGDGDGSDTIAFKIGRFIPLYDPQEDIPLVPGVDNTEADISGHVQQINKFTDTGTGEIPSAQFMLNAIDGAFVTNENNGFTPIIKQFQTLRLEVRGGTWDEDVDDTHHDSNTNRDAYARYLIVERVTPQKNRYGTFLSVEAVARERYLQRMYLPGQFYYYTASQMIDYAVKFYNENRGSEQPEIDTGDDYQAMLNALPRWTTAIYEFGHQSTVYDVLLDVIRRLTAPVADAGAGEQYYLKFADGISDGMTATKLKLYIKPQGDNVTRTGSSLQIENPISITKSQNEYEGNIVRVEGQAGFGSYPRNISMWNSVVEQFTNTPKWESGFDYKRDAHVRRLLKMWRAKRDVVNSTMAPAENDDWAEVPFHDYWAVKFHKMTYDDFYHADNDADRNSQRNTPYSPWTRNRQLEWANSAGNARGITGSSSLNLINRTNDATNYDRLCYPDCNLIIRDEAPASPILTGRDDDVGRGWRDWADFRVTSLTQIPDKYLLDANEAKTTDYIDDISGISDDEKAINRRCYEGMKILIDENNPTFRGTGTQSARGGQGFLSGFDINGKDRSGSLVIRDNDGEWVVIKEPKRYDEVAVLYEGKVYEYGPAYARHAPDPVLDPISSLEYLLRGPYVNTQASSDQWRDASFAIRAGNDCFHYPYQMTPSDGLISNQTLFTEEYGANGINENYIDFNDGASSTYTSGSAMKIGYQIGMTSDQFGLAENVFKPLSRGAESIWTAISSFLTDQARSFVDVLSGNFNVGSLRANDITAEAEPGELININFFAVAQIPDEVENLSDVDVTLLNSDETDAGTSVAGYNNRGGTFDIITVDATNRVEMENSVTNFENGTRLIRYRSSSSADTGVTDQVKYKLTWVDDALTPGDTSDDMTHSDIGVITIDLVEPEFTTDSDGNKIFVGNQERHLHRTDQYNDGWWATLLEFPFPKSTYGMPSGKVGSIVKAPVVNLNNLNETASGKKGFGHADSEELGELDGIGFLFRFNITGGQEDLMPQLYQAANIPFRATCYDTRGNVWIHDFVVRFQGGIQQVRLWFRNFKIYRARTQIGYTWATWIKNIQNPEMLTLDSFSRRKLKRVTLQCMYGYDEYGRFDPYKFEAMINRFIPNPDGHELTYTGEIDALHFIKTPLVIVKADSADDLHLEAKTKRYPHISNLIQLQNIAYSELHLAQHQHERWVADIPNTAKIISGETVRISNSDTGTIGPALDLYKGPDDRSDDRELIVGRVTYSVGDRGTSTGLITSVEMFRKLGMDVQ